MELPEAGTGAPLKDGSGSFTCANGMRVFCYRPPNERFNADSPPLIVLHGLQRDADNYFTSLMGTGEPERLGVLLLVPDFSEELFPKKTGYNFGNVFTQDPERWKPAKDGGPGAVLPPLNSPERWAFTAVEQCFDEACARTGSLAKSYILFGHSAGAQFVHRFALCQGAAAAGGVVPALRVHRCICANAGWYTMPTSKHKFPYGLSGLPGALLGGLGCGAEVERALADCFVQFPMTLLLGDADVDPNKPRPEIWRDTPEANEQGPHRFARGKSFFQAGKTVAQEHGVKFGWDLQVVPGVGHHGGAMSAIALAMFFDPEARGGVHLPVLKKVAADEIA